MGNHYKKLVGERIYLSPVSMDDVEIFTKWLNDLEVTDYIGRSSALQTLEGEKDWVQNQVKNAEYLMTIVTTDNDQAIGNISLVDINNLNRTAVLGILIGEEEYRSKGYGAEAIKLLLDFAFNYLNLNSVSLTLLEGNERAKKCYEKVGFKEFGRQRECIYLNGKYYDRIFMDILASEFKEEFIKNKNVK